MKRSQFVQYTKPIKTLRQTQTSTNNTGDYSFDGNVISTGGDIVASGDLVLLNGLCLSSEKLTLTDSLILPNATVTYYTLTTQNVSGNIQPPVKDCELRIVLDVSNGYVLELNFASGVLKSPSGYTDAQKAVLDRDGNTLSLMGKDGVWYTQNAECCIVDSSFVPF